MKDVLENSAKRQEWYRVGLVHTVGFSVALLYAETLRNTMTTGTVFLVGFLYGIGVLMSRLWKGLHE